LSTFKRDIVTLE
jgi:hypothetical protein